MNPPQIDTLYYHSLFWIPRLLPMTASLVILAWVIHALIAHYQYSVGGSQKSPARVHVTFGFLLAALLVIYVPVPNPARFLGMSPLGGPNGQSTTAGIFLLERLSVAIDSHLVHVFAFDQAIKAGLAQEGTQLAGLVQDIPINRPTKSDLVFSLIWYRAVFIIQMTQILSPETSFWEALNPKNLLMYAALAGMALLALLVFAFAALIKGGPIILMAMGAYCLGWGILFSKLKALFYLVVSTLSMLLIKPVLFIVIYQGFWMVEAAIFQGFVEEYRDSEMVQLVDHFGPGYLFTPAGGEILQKVDLAHQGGSLFMTLAAVLGMLLMCIYFVFRTPGILSRYLEQRTEFEDVLVNSFFTASALAVRYLKLPQMKGRGNQVKPTGPALPPPPTGGRS